MTKLLTIADAAALLSCSESKLRAMVKRRRIGHVEVEGSVRLSEAQVQKYIAERSVDAVEPEQRAPRVKPYQLRYIKLPPTQPRRASSQSPHPRKSARA